MITPQLTKDIISLTQTLDIIQKQLKEWWTVQKDIMYVNVAPHAPVLNHTYYLLEFMWDDCIKREEEKYKISVNSLSLKSCLTSL